jgi:hypothetical protein
MQENSGAHESRRLTDFVQRKRRTLTLPAHEKLRGVCRWNNLLGVRPEKMKKRFIVTLNIPVAVEVEANNDNGEVVITSVMSVALPSVGDINDSCTIDNLDAIDEAFEGAG